MFSLTRYVVRAAFGAGRGEGALLAMPIIPAAAVLDIGRAGIGAVRRAVLRGRQGVAKALRAAAQRLDPAPVASPLLVRYARLSLPLVAAPEPVQPVLLMASAAQETLEAKPAESAADYYRKMVEAYGSQKRAAEAIGIHVSKLRRLLKKD